ncbi:hypothetical protein D3C86_1253640 [compost metagenome]
MSLNPGIFKVPRIFEPVMEFCLKVKSTALSSALKPPPKFAPMRAGVGSLGLIASNPIVPDNPPVPISKFLPFITADEPESWLKNGGSLMVASSIKTPIKSSGLPSAVASGIFMVLLRSSFATLKSISKPVFPIADGWLNVATRLRSYPIPASVLNEKLPALKPRIVLTSSSSIGSPPMSSNGTKIDLGNSNPAPKFKVAFTLGVIKSLM